MKYYHIVVNKNDPNDIVMDTRDNNEHVEFLDAPLTESEKANILFVLELDPNVYIVNNISVDDEYEHHPYLSHIIPSWLE